MSQVKTRTLINRCMTYYTLYKVTNKINGKFYIGTHKTKNLDDNYMGSGKYLTHAIKKYGIENFEKEILFVFDNPDDMYAKESEIVNEDFLSEKNTYNLKIGGFGGWDYVNSSKKNLYGNNGKKGYGGENLKQPYHMRDDLTLQEKQLIRGKISKRLVGRPGTFCGKTHTEDTKRKIGRANALNQAGSKNSQYGTIWIHNVDIRKNKKIAKDTTIPDGWTKGRVYDFEKFIKLSTKKKNKAVSRQSKNSKECKERNAKEWYDKFLRSNAKSIREFVRTSDYPYSHVAFSRMLKTYIIESQITPT